VRRDNVEKCPAHATPKARARRMNVPPSPRTMAISPPSTAKWSRTRRRSWDQLKISEV
jgi:hypothetical protein